MSPTLLLPLVVSLLAAIGAGLLQRQLRPSVAAWSLTVAAVVSAAAVVGGLAMVMLNFVHVAPGDGALAWCLQMRGPHGGAPWLPAGLGVVWAVVAAFRLRRCRVEYRQLSPSTMFPDDVEVIEGADPLAFTLPGRRGRIVVSTSMLAQLSAPEQAVLLAHERSHLRHRHDRFIHAADLASAIVPTLGRLSRRVRFATERWADEEAAAEVGDRRLVARAVARAGLIQRGTLQPGLALAGWGVRARVEDLLEEPPSGSAATAVESASAMALAIVVGSSAVQLHHLGMIAAHLC